MILIQREDRDIDDMLCGSWARGGEGGTVIREAQNEISGIGGFSCQ
jgi:hypothetical protein